MKTILTLLVAIISTITVAHAAYPEQRLADLQIEESALKVRYSDNNPLLKATQSQISSLESVPNIKNEKYFGFLKENLTRLKAERADLSTKYADTDPQIITADAQIRFIELTLKTNAG